MAILKKLTFIPSSASCKQKTHLNSLKPKVDHLWSLEATPQEAVASPSIGLATTTPTSPSFDYPQSVISCLVCGVSKWQEVTSVVSEEMLPNKYALDSSNLGHFTLLLETTMKYLWQTKNPMLSVPKSSNAAKKTLNFATPS